MIYVRRCDKSQRVLSDRTRLDNSDDRVTVSKKTRETCSVTLGSLTAGLWENAVPRCDGNLFSSPRFCVGSPQHL